VSIIMGAMLHQAHAFRSSRGYATPRSTRKV
jgi:hypothetical protein